MMTVREQSSVVVDRHFAAQPQDVFNAFATEELLKRWLSPSPDVALTVLSFDFRVGGAYQYAYHLPDGRTLVVGGRYRTIDVPACIAFSWRWEPPDEHAGIESEVVVTITPEGSGSRLHIQHNKLDTAGMAERHAEGWSGALERLGTLLSTRGLGSAV